MITTDDRLPLRLAEAALLEIQDVLFQNHGLMARHGTWSKKLHEILEDWRGSHLSENLTTNIIGFYEEVTGTPWRRFLAAHGAEDQATATASTPSAPTPKIDPRAMPPSELRQRLATIVSVDEVQDQVAAETALLACIESLGPAYKEAVAIYRERFLLTPERLWLLAERII